VQYMLGRGVTGWFGRKEKEGGGAAGSWVPKVGLFSAEIKEGTENPAHKE